MSGFTPVLMPFTFSHPALIIPLLRRRRQHPWLSATGLITGSIAPDFEKFFRLHLASGHSHTAASIFYFSCPVSLALAFIFHQLVRRPLLRHLPAPLHRRLAWLLPFDWIAYFRQYYGGVLLSIIVGAALHLFWDSFTHQNSLLVRWLPGLNRIVWLGGSGVPLLEVLTLLSTVAGGLVIIWAIWQMPARRAGPPPTAAALWHYWGMAALVALALLVEWVLATKPDLLNVNVGIAAISTTLVGVLVASVYTRYRYHLT